MNTYLKNFVKNKGVRWTYIRDKSRHKVGLFATFFEKDADGHQEIWVGWSKCNVSVDKFDFNLGLSYAIGTAMPVNEFIQHCEGGYLPKISLCWRNVRGNDGKITGEITWYNQYDQFVNRLRKMVEAYYNLQLT